MDKIFIVAFLLCSVEAAMAQLRGDMIINEVLFNPAKDGYDYVECYNRSKLVLHLNNIAIANRNGAGDLASIKQLVKDSSTLGPGQFIVITANEKWLRLNYQVDDNANVIQLSSLPSFPDDEGTVVLIRRSDSTVIDELRYSAKWHSKIIKDVEGVALERISYDVPVNDMNNWTSAASSADYGTPGRVNSQHLESVSADQMLSLHPKVISPNNDGIDDFVLLEVNVHESGWIANTMIYDVEGRRVNYLLKNAVLGSNNRFVWDGYNEVRERVPNGIYIVVTRMFDLRGNTKKYKHCVVVDYRQ